MCIAARARQNLDCYLLSPAGSLYSQQMKRSLEFVKICMCTILLSVWSYQNECEHIKWMLRTSGELSERAREIERQRVRESERETMAEGEKRGENYGDWDQKQIITSIIASEEENDARALCRWWKQARRQLRWLYQSPIAQMISKSKTKDPLVERSDVRKRKSEPEHQRNESCSTTNDIYSQKIAQRTPWKTERFM